ncbi:MAG TPA: hypothetical protein DEA47_05085 [Peptococcaceae bacterium]|nr:MAG: FdrA [Clostridia bacterium 41_269]HBT20717.1 hypothetical protein [Peptococcaceae bacterium]
MVVRWLIKPNMYQDSVKLMKLTAEIQEMEGISQASVVMATDMNKAVLKDAGLLVSEVAEANANDLVIVVAADEEEHAEKALKAAEKLLETFNVEEGKTEKQKLPKTIQRGVEVLPGANLALISVPGTYAAAEAVKALNMGLNVHLFSDNVSLEDEVRLKELGCQKGLLVMGPDCGTAIIDGVPLAFANVVERGKIGIVGASGTGIQEATVLIERLGAGISHAIGTGGRDLSGAVGGRMMLMGIDLLEEDPSTEVILLVSKPAGSQTTPKILERVRKCRKPVVVCILKEDLSGSLSSWAVYAATIEDAAYKAVALANGEEPLTIPANFWGDYSELVSETVRNMRPEQQYLRGLFTGGTLADEAMLVLGNIIGDIYSNIPLKPELRLPSSQQSKAHTIIDLGDDEFTRGRPHPMIDPLPRNERLLQEYKDPEVAVILRDVVTGYGSHPDPAGELARAVMEAREAYPNNNAAVIAFVCGTEGDPQPLSAQVETLEKAGIMVLPSNAEAARVAGRIIKQLESKGV